MNRKKTGLNILLGVTGSVAAVKLPELARLINGDEDLDANLRIVLTENSKKFIDPIVLQDLASEMIIYDDASDWSMWSKLGDKVLHIELRKWADVVLVAPLDACTLAKIAAGICDNLLTCVIRAMDIKNSTLIVCPAMNTLMWENPLTQMHLNLLTKVYRSPIVGPISKKLACNDTGMGGLSSPDSILAFMKDLHLKPSSHRNSLSDPHSHL